MILGLNTATTRTCIALINEETIVNEKSWIAEQNEAETLLPELQKMLDKNNLIWEDLTKIAVITGPGPFTALRVSVAIANALGYGLGIKIIDIPVKDFWEFRVGDDFALYAGGNKIYYNANLYDVDDFLLKINENTAISGQLRKTHIDEIKARGGKYVNEKDLKTFGEFLFANINKFEQKDIVKPRYFSKPHITVSKKHYK